LSPREKIIKKYADTLRTLGMPESLIPLVVNGFISGYDARQAELEVELESQETMDNYIVH
jgi:hypothetical protein